MNKLLLIGGGGHCKSVVDSLLSIGAYSSIGIIDIKENIGNRINGIPIIGCDEDLKELYEAGYEEAFITVGSVGNPKLRVNLYKKLKGLGYQIPKIIDPTAVVANSVKIEEAVFVGKGVIINSDTIIKRGAIINSGAIIEHDCRIGSFVHIAPGVVMSGGVIIGDSSHIGSNTSVRQQVSIGSDTIVGIGSVVVKHISSNVIAYGNPCKEVKDK